jgi:hypothetical protein
VKRCRRCGAEKALNEFPLQSQRPDGRDAYCKTCRAEYTRSWYRRNRERILERHRTLYRTEKYREYTRARRRGG